MSIDWCEYKSLDAWVQHNYRFKATVVDAVVYWSRKHDGSNISLLFHKGFPIFYTHHQKAIPQVEVEVKGLLKPIMDNLKELLGERYIIYFELMRKGKSPAGYENYEESQILAFDLYDMEEEHWVDPAVSKIRFKTYNIPYIPLYAYTTPSTIESFESTIDEMLELAKVLGWEGFIAKWMHKGDMYAVKVKVEHKYPKKPKEKRRRILDERPQLELSEVTGAIERVFNEVGTEKFRDKKVAMPLIAKAVGIEERKHRKKNRYPIFALYLERLKKEGE